MIKHEFILQQFDEVEKRESTSKFYKVDLHVHTPASINDYKVNDKFYELVTLEELKEIAVQKGLVNGEGMSTLNITKDELTALLIIHEACALKEINMLVVTDHNNLNWYEILTEAAVTYFSNYNPKNKFVKEFSILPGVEITCFNGAHIIAILEPKHYKDNWNYLGFELAHNMDIKNDEIFTTKSEIDVVHAIKKVGGIVYIPHIDNNSQKFRMDDILNPLLGLSKAELFINPLVQAVGFTQYDRFKEFVEGVLNDKKHRYFRKIPLAYMQDSDAHSIDEIGRRFMYIKMSKLTFESLRYALEEPEIRIKKINEESKDIPYIRGVITSGGFLSKDNGRLSYYPFNRDLNCIIGGRGTGKSTLINCIKSCFEGRTETPSFRKFISEFNSILIYFYFRKKNYCLVCEPIIKRDSYTGDEVSMYSTKTKHDQVKIEDWIKLYEINNSKVKKITIGRQAELLSDFHIDFFKQAQVYKIGEDKSYLKQLISSVFERCDAKEEYLGLVNELSSELKVLSNIVYNEKLMSLEKLNEYQNCQERITKINKRIFEFRSEVVSSLNDNMKDKVSIILKENNNGLNEKLQDMLDNYSKLISLSAEKVNYVSKCISYLCEKYELFTLWEILINNSFILENKIKESNILISEKVENVIDDIMINEYINIVKEVFIRHIKSVNGFKENYRIDVEFNVNSYTSNSNKLFKPILDLSLGQKAVAILLIITEGINGIVKSFPLIIDQPEDHLDNRFIFEHLVKGIRDLKEERQVILVTHNANIPVSGDAENVIHLVSDNKNGWIDMHGPIDDMRISEKVLSIMEGGKDSFNMRNNKYKILNYVE